MQDCHSVCASVFVFLTGFSRDFKAYTMFLTGRTGAQYNHQQARDTCHQQNSVLIPGTDADLKNAQALLRIHTKRLIRDIPVWVGQCAPGAGTCKVLSIHMTSSSRDMYTDAPAATFTSPVVVCVRGNREYLCVSMLG